MGKAQRAARIEHGYRISAYSFLPHSSRTTVLVLCLNLGRTYTFHCRRKSKRAAKGLGFLVNVWFWSAVTLTLNQRGREFKSSAANESLFTAGLRRLWAERVRLLCYNFARTI